MFSAFLTFLLVGFLVGTLLLSDDDEESSINLMVEKIELENGQFDVTGFTDYIIPTLTEMPEFHVKILENPYPFGPYGAKGLGELPFVGAAPAVVSALWMIFGKEFNFVPILPEHLYKLFSYEN